MPTKQAAPPLSFKQKALKQFKWLAAAACALAVIHMAMAFAGYPSWHLERLFHMGRENNIPTWYTSFLCLVVSLSAAYCFLHTPYPSDKSVYGLLIIFFAALSCDEVASLHESVGEVFSHIFKPKSALLGARKTSWPIFVIPLFLAGLLLFSPWIRKHAISFKRILPPLIPGMGLFFLSAVVLEMTSNFMVGSSLGWMREAETIFEETFEMLSAILIAFSLFGSGD